MSQVIPRRPVPPLSVPTLDHGPFDLASCTPERFTLIVFYRGLHCPVCRGYIKELANLVPEFAGRGTDDIAISTDIEERAREAQTQWELAGVKIGYGMSITTVPQRFQPADKPYVRKSGAGRPRKEARLVFEGIVYVLRTG